MTSDLAAGAARALVEVTVARGWDTIVTWLQNHKSDAQEGASGDIRAVAYDKFRDAVVEYRVSIGMLAASHLTLRGALWPFSLSLRLVLHLPERSSALTSTLLGVETVGRRDAIAAAEDLAIQAVLATQACADAWVKNSRHNREAADEALAGLDEQLAKFATVVRADLGYK